MAQSRDLMALLRPMIPFVLPDILQITLVTGESSKNTAANTAGAEALKLKLGGENEKKIRSLFFLLLLLLPAIPRLNLVLVYITLLPL